MNAGLLHESQTHYALIHDPDLPTSLQIGHTTSSFGILGRYPPII